MPNDFEGREAAPPKDLQKAISEQVRPCGSGRFAWSWKAGPSRGKPMTVYCAEPLCLKTGSCTGPRFVPHLVQYVHIEDDGTPGAPRKVSLNEQLAASRFAAKMAEEETGVPDSRTDAEVLDHVQWVRKALAAALGY